MESDSDLEANGGEPVGMSHEELYTVVNAAVADALFTVLATVALLGLGLLFLSGGLQVLFETSTNPGYVSGGLLLGVGLMLVAAAFDLVPFFHERLLG